MGFSLEELKNKGIVKANNGGNNNSLANLKRNSNNGINQLDQRINNLAAQKISSAGIELAKNATEMIFILDMSGSCEGTEEATIKGIYELMESEKKNGFPCKVSIVLFNEENKVVCKRLDINKVQPLNYRADGGTALYDAVCNNLQKIQKEQMRDNIIKPEKTIVTIMTDGMDNSSSRYSLYDTQSLIAELKRIGWKFIFLGAWIDAKNMANNLGIDQQYAEQYQANSQGILTNFQAVRRALMDIRQTGKINKNWSDSIRKLNNSTPALNSGNQKRLRLTGGK